MPRRKTMVQLRKYLIILFGILLIFIWLNHENLNFDEYDDPNQLLVTLNNSKPSQNHNLPQVIHDDDLGRLNRFNLTDLILKMERKDEIRKRKQEDIEHKFEFHSTEATNSSIKARYFVFSNKCKMPYADPFSREVREIYNPSKLKVCTNEADLFALKYNTSTMSYKLHINEKLLIKLKPQFDGNYKCNYRAISRGTNSSRDHYSDVQPRAYFKHNITLPQTVKGIIVECHEAKNVTRIVQQDAFHVVQMHNISKRIESNPLKRQPSVIMIGLHSMSRMNLRRTMPKTAQFVSQPGWFEMEGYNKVGDNNVANLVPVLSGHPLSKLRQLPSVCDKVLVDCMDKMPFIWKDYKSAGYATALAEDVLHSVFSSISEFESLSGFFNEPTDHYLRPLLLSIDKIMKIYSRFGYHYCLGRRLSVSYVYDFCLQFTKRYIEELDQPVFGLFWSCTFTHDFYFDASSLDDKLLDYFHAFEKHELFEKAIVIFFSDHGSRFGDLIELSDGFLEERMPMLHIYLPPWFRETYPTYTQALYINHNRLSSNYDLHNTLRHILQLNATNQTDLPFLANCPGSQSLLHPLPLDRSCQDACIGEHFCTCNEYINQLLDGDMYYLGKLVVYHINRWMLLNGFNLLCQRILLLDMDNAEKKVLFEENGKVTMYGTIAIYRLRFRTYPDEGKFQTTVHFNRELKTIDNLYVPDISRLNSYFNSSQCIEDRIAKKFCFCYPDGQLNEFMDGWRGSKLTTIPI